MNVAISEQALALAGALITGAALGLGYDILRPARYKAEKIAAALLDLLFCAAAAVILFCGGMRTGNGKTGTWEMLFTLAGFLLYLYTISGHVLKLVFAVYRKCGLLLKSTEKFLKKLALSAKKFFSNVTKCFIIKR